jgi:hypothetical protein
LPRRRARSSRQKARDDIAGFLQTRQGARASTPVEAPTKHLSSLNGAADGFAAALCGRDLAPRCQDAELN